MRNSDLINALRRSTVVLIVLLLSETVLAIDFEKGARNLKRHQEWMSIEIRDPVAGFFVQSRSATEDQKKNATLAFSFTPKNGKCQESVDVIFDMGSIQSEDERDGTIELLVDTCLPNRKKTDYYDESIIGFLLEVRHTGGKTYYLKYRTAHHDLRQHKIGDAKSISCEKARQSAQKLRSIVVLGGDPAEDRKVLRAVPTVSEYVEQKYIPTIQRTRRNISSSTSVRPFLISLE